MNIKDIKLSKKKTSEPIDKPSFGEIVRQIVDKEYGKVMTSGSSVISENRMIIPITPVIDPLVGGGVTEGSWMSISGKYGTGKTTTALRIAANAQRPEYGSREVYYLSVEGRFKRSNALGTRGLKVEAPYFNLIESKPDAILDAEGFLRIAEIIIASHPGCVLIIDSPSAFASSEARAQGVAYQNRGQVNKSFSELVRQNAQTVRVNKSIVICCVHLAKSQGFGAGWDEKIAESLNYAAELKLRIKYDSAFKDTSEKRIGQELHWEVDKSDLGSGGTATGYIRYGTGIDVSWELFEVGKELGLIDQSGANYTLEFLDGEPQTIKGKQKVWEFLEENPDAAQRLATKIREML